MKQRHIISLLQTGFTTIHCSFPARLHSNCGTEKTYAYKASGWIEPGDHVVVEREGILSIAVVKVVDKVAQIDPDADFAYKWIVQKVDQTEYLKIQAEERAFNDALQAIEQERLRETILERFTASLPAGSKARGMFDTALKGITGIQSEAAK